MANQLLPGLGAMTYWQGPRNDTIEACFASARKAYGSLHVFTRGDVPEEVAGSIGGPDEVLKLTDVFRLWALWKYGGLWVDADTLTLEAADLGRLCEQGVEAVGCGHGNGGRITNVMLACHSKADVMRDMYLGLKEQHERATVGGLFYDNYLRDGTKRLACIESRNCFHPRKTGWKKYRLGGPHARHLWWGSRAYHLRGETVQWAESHPGALRMSFLGALLKLAAR